MPRYSLHTEADREKFINLLRVMALDKPWMVTVEREGNQRSLNQNRLQRLFVNEISEQLGDQTPEEVRGYCKLTIGVPILRMENEAFREKYDRIIRPLPYEQKLELMMEPIDFPVTRLMNTKQHAKYLDEIQRHFAAQGVILTQPGIG